MTLGKQFLHFKLEAVLGRRRSTMKHFLTRGVARAIAAVIVALCAVALLGTVGCSGDDADNPTGQFSSIEWPDSGPALLIPHPGSDFGTIQESTPTKLSALLGDYNREKFAFYIEACEAAGFTVNEAKGGESFVAENSQGAKLRLDFHRAQGYMALNLEVPQNVADALQELADISSGNESAAPGNSGKNQPSASVDNEGAGSSSGSAGERNGAAGQEATESVTKGLGDSSAPAPTDGASGGNADQSGADASNVTPEFKEAMDGYEALVDEALATLQVNEEDPDASGFESLGQILSMYLELKQSLDAIDTDSLSAADLAYFEEVTPRIFSKLAQLYAYI